MELEKAQRLFRFEAEKLVTLIAELKIMTSNERATVKTLKVFSEEVKGKLQIRVIARERWLDSEEKWKLASWREN